MYATFVVAKKLFLNLVSSEKPEFPNVVNLFVVDIMRLIININSLYDKTSLNN